MAFNPKYIITHTVLQNLMQIETIRKAFAETPIPPVLVSSLHQTAKIASVHYSTKIEGNRLTMQQVESTIANKNTIQNRERDAREVRAYYDALDFIEEHLDSGGAFSEEFIKKVHSIAEREEYSCTYRDGQNAIYNSSSDTVVYMPPEATDVPDLMKDLVDWANNNQAIPPTILAGIVHYQFVTIYPYYDGNDKTARLITNFIMRKIGLGLQGTYSLEEYYAKDLPGYYDALTIRPHHNYYEDRENIDLTNWVHYFVSGVAASFETIFAIIQAKVIDLSKKNSIVDYHAELRKLDIKQRKILELFIEFAEITSLQIAECLGTSQQNSRLYANKWIKDGFLVISSNAKKNRKYALEERYEKIAREKQTPM